jgi:hypothetical protein
MLNVPVGGPQVRFSSVCDYNFLFMSHKRQRSEVQKELI